MQELKQNEILYKVDIDNSSSFFDDSFPKYDKVFKEIETSIEIQKEGYNLYIIDNYSNEKLNKIVSHINSVLKEKRKPHDICYVVFDDDKSPKPLFLSGGMGKLFQKNVSELEKSYREYSFEFYNNMTVPDKMLVMNELEASRNKRVNLFMEKAKNNGYEVKSSEEGFIFVPLDNNDLLNDNVEILNMLKKEAQDMLTFLKNKELEAIEKLKDILLKYYETEMAGLKQKIFTEFQNEQETLNYLKYICSDIEKSLVDNYSISFEDDRVEINEIVMKHKVNVLVNNEDLMYPPVIYEEDPTPSNLIGTIEYVNKNGNYDTNSLLIKAGSILKSNDGCLVIRASSLLSNQGAWNALKKVLMTEKLCYDFNKNYLEILSLGYINPYPVKINTKIILIGSMYEYYVLYNYDDDFKRIFKLKAEYDPVIDLNSEAINFIKSFSLKICKESKIENITDGAVMEIARVLSRKAENRKKLYIDENIISNLIMLSYSKIKNERKKTIDQADIIKSAFREEVIENELVQSFKDGKILLNVEESKIGQVNGLSVLDSGYFRFGRPFKITCSCSPGQGEIFDIQKESNLSGNIHNKSVNILKGYINNLLEMYERIPVDFHISFEQVYGKVEGDSASVAETISMISALTKIPVKQNIAVTGSINQFGEVQPVGGINDKIEGFFKTCLSLGSIENKGVLIPYLNKDDLVLNPFVEEEISNGRFHIYVMKNMNDAFEIMMEKGTKYRCDVSRTAKREVKKYFKKDNNSNK